MLAGMSALIESEARPMAPFDLAAISQQLAEDVSRLVPDSDGYSVEDYFSLDGAYLVEFVDGRLQVLPMPDALHQAIIRVLCNLFEHALERDPDARVVMSPFKVYLNDRLYREPDVALMLGQHASRRSNDFWRGADLVVEVISESNRRHDVITKMTDYAQASIPEYWIVDPTARSISVFVLVDGTYQQIDSHAVAQSRVLPGLAVNVMDLFALAAKKA
jgi:Uma2 family endonuclease